MSHSVQWIFFKLCIQAVNVLKMCMWVLLDLELILTELWPFELSHSRETLHCRVWILCYQVAPQFSMDLFQTLSTYCGHI